MTPTREAFRTSTLTRPGDLVKAKILALGLRLGDVAMEAGLPAARLSDVLGGRSRNRAVQYRVACAVRNLSGQRALTMRELFGDLLEGQP